MEGNVCCLSVNGKTARLQNTRFIERQRANSMEGEGMIRVRARVSSVSVAVRF